MTNETQVKLLTSLRTTYFKLNEKENANANLRKVNEKKAKNSDAGKKYFYAVEKYQERKEKNIKMQNAIITFLAILAALVVFGITLALSFKIVIGNLDTIMLPISDTAGLAGWTSKQYGVLYTLGILMFTAAVSGIVLCVIDKKDTTILGVIYLVLGILSYIAVIIYALINGQGTNKILGIFLILIVPFALILSPFNVAGVGDQFVAMMPSILMILLTLVVIGVVYVVIVRAIKINAEKKKTGDTKLIELKKEVDKAYSDYNKVLNKINAESKFISTTEENKQIEGYINALKLSPQNANMQKVCQLLWCIENNYANNIIEANNWLYNDANRKRAEAETARHRANILKKADELERNIGKKLDAQNESIKNVGKKVDELNKSVQNQKIVVENNIDIEIK